MSDAAWLVEQSGFDVARANYYETLFTVGNGRLGTRGSLEEGHLGQLSGTFIAGVYDGHAEREAGATHLRQAGGGLEGGINVERRYVHKNLRAGVGGAGLSRSARR